jgi:hypothetical protein
MRMIVELIIVYLTTSVANFGKKAAEKSRVKRGDGRQWGEIKYNKTQYV